jgi:uncharacterized OB-fold protein
MNKFEQELKLGNFVTSECHNCNKIVWPPSNYCDICLNDVVWRKVSSNAKLIEWSKNGNEIFCIAEFENTIRIIGKINSKTPSLKPGQSIKLIKCTLNNKPRFFLE